jgi:benzoate-CoA ligase
LNTANAAVELLTPNLLRNPGKVAYYCGDRSLSFRDLDLASRGFAVRLRNEGVTPGERILLALPDSLAFPVAFLGSLLAGALAVVIGSDWGADEIAFVAADSGARLLVIAGGIPFDPLPGSDLFRTITIGDDDLFESRKEYSELLEPFHPSAGDLSHMLYSSGTTGRPKGVPHRHGSLLLPCENVGRSILGITGEDVIFSTSKSSFAYGLVNSIAFPLCFGASAVLHTGKPDPLEVLDIIRQQGVSILFSVPAVYRQIVLSVSERHLHLPLRLCLSAGEVLPPPLLEEWRNLTGLEILDGMGATETAYHFLCNTPGAASPGSAGRLVAGYRAKVVDDDGEEAPAGSEGNLLIKGDTVAPYYWNLPELTAEKFGPDGFFRTGDRCVERDGLFFHRGRNDEMFRVDGQWVSPLAVEEALRGHRLVSDCAVAAVTVGNLVRPMAFVVVKDGSEGGEKLVKELREHLKGSLPTYMCPVRFRFVKELPRTSTGKLQRSRLKNDEK